ncbi:MAG: zinc-ribbon domain-containing protein [Lachnospiraceae bacterium]|nr:zinc-ribbon domain-containing protein [Lachnospiraceae bacterium]MBD5506006.1 zinc-ribbon domain-containing protein [Lachnospiraceae bacterium]
MDCPSCGKKVLETANFCKYCNAKIKDTCSYCWVKKEDNYNCGESNCPGYGLFRLEKLKSQ